MKIKRITWQNFKGLADGEIVCDGQNVTISGRNGVGKSSIASILPFVLFGKIAAKSFDERGLTIESQLPTATIEFDAITLKRSVTARNQNRTFINGEEISATNFNATILNLTKGAGTLLFNPFEFPNLHWKEQRDFLLKHFAKAELPENPDELKDEMKSVKREATGIPYQISEVQRQLNDLPTGDISELEAILATRQSELASLQTEDFSRQRRFLTEQIRTQERLREQLLKKYHGLKSICPTCGQKLPKSKIDAARERIVTDGKEVSAMIEQLRAELETLKSKENFSVERLVTVKKLQSEIRGLTKQIAELHTGERLQKRLATLIEREKSLNSKLVELEGKIAASQELRRNRLAESENAVNSQFQHVKFKLFKVLANGDISETCEPMINGVPYSSLSKGEKLKAALDILNTLQKKFGIEMPLFLDDAESYTSNSFVDLPNQLFLFKVDEENLAISIDERRRAA